MTDVGWEESQAHISHMGDPADLKANAEPAQQLNSSPDATYDERLAELEDLAFEALRQILIQPKDKRAKLKAAEIILSRKEDGGSFADAVADLLKG